MASAYYIARKDKTNKQGECPIHIVYEHASEQCRITTDHKINPALFDTKKPGAWVNPVHPSHIELNIIFSEALAAVTKTYNMFYLENKRFPKPDELKKIYGVQTGKITAPDNSFFAIFREFQIYQEEKRGSDNVSPGTAKNYRKFKERMAEFETYIKKPLTFEEINKQFYNTFVSYLCDEHGNGVNSCGAYIKILKTFLFWCEAHKDIPVDRGVMKTLKVTSEENWKAFLTIEELDQVIALDLSNNPDYDLSRDAFVLQCHIGSRYSDMARLTGGNIIIEGGETVVRQTTVKTRKLSQGVLTEPAALNILEKYKGSSVKDWIPEMQKCNRDIKEVCRLAGINEEITLTTGTGIYRKDAVVKKYQLITTHSARRTFINLCLRAGILDVTIALSTGQSIKTLQRYKHADINDLKSASNAFSRLRQDKNNSRK